MFLLNIKHVNTYYFKSLFWVDIPIFLALSNCFLGLQQYWVHNLPDVTKQCTINNLIPSLLFKDSQFLMSHLNSSSLSLNNAQIENITEDAAHITLSPICTKSYSEDTLSQISDSELVNEKAVVANEIENTKEKILELEKEIKLAEQQLQQVSYVILHSTNVCVIMINLVGGSQGK